MTSSRPVGYASPSVWVVLALACVAITQSPRLFDRIWSRHTS